MTSQRNNSLPAGYSASDVDRWVQEPVKPVTRGHFARDRARVVHSSAFRRLGGKTQVLGPGSDDFSRTRLTHSLEVAQVGREIAVTLGCDPDVVDAACLAHDLGHPPFGHHGEAVLHEVSHSIGGFEGNAQTLRLLTRLEPKVMCVAGPTAGPAGLNLTRATLDATTKYPWAAGAGPGPSKKFGVYADDVAVFEWLRAGAPAHAQCMEAMVMDLADDIAYSVHDVEDAMVGGWFDPSMLNDEVTRGTIVQIAQSFCDQSLAALDVAVTNLQHHPLWLADYSASRTDRARLKDLTSQLIGHFAVSARSATRAEFGPGPLTRYHAHVVLPEDSAAQIAVLKAIAVHFVMNHETRQEEYSTQRALILDLVEVLSDSGPLHLEPLFVEDWLQAGDDAARLRVIVDQISVLTDSSAMILHHTLCGPDQKA